MPNPLRILLIEDDSNDVLLVKSLLKEEIKWTIIPAPRLAEGLELISQQKFDVILSDLGLPDSFGLATFAELHKKAPSVPIIVFTVKNDTAIGCRAIHDGAQDFLPKAELTSLLLSRTIRHAIERKRLEAEREKLISELQTALAEVKTLSGLLPICSHCKKIRDDKGYWNQIEIYIKQHSHVSFTHGLCPECLVQIAKENGLQMSDRLRKAAKH